MTDKEALITRLREEATHALHHQTIALLLEAAQALAAPVQEPVAWMDALGDIYKHELWPDWNPPHTFLYATPPAAQPAPVPCCGKYETCTQACTPRGKFLGAREAAAQPAPVQEPVADKLIQQYITALVANKPDEAANATKAMVDYVYTTPPQRPWLDLTDEQIKAIEAMALTKNMAIAMTMAALKEVNT